MAADNDQFKEVRCIHCLLCNVSKPLKGFLSHIRQQHLNYHRYKCTTCMFKSDDEDESAFHSFEKTHYVKFDNASYQEQLASKVFQDCCREQFAARHRIRKLENNVSWKPKKRKSWNSCSDIEKMRSSKTSEMKANDVCSFNSLNREINLQTMPENRRNHKIATNSKKCLNDEEKLESDVCITKIVSKAAPDGNESCKLSETDDKTSNALGLFSDALENMETINSDKFQNVTATDDVVLDDDFASGSNMHAFDCKKRVVENISVPQSITPKLNIACRKCGKDVAVDYIAKKTHALQFHFTQEDDPEIAELLPSTIKACFPHSLSWSDYQCTECGKALGTYGSRRNHVLKEHFYWSAICPLPGCTVVFNAIGSLREHFKSEHNISELKMPKGLKQKLGNMENDRKNDLHRQLIHCFPCSIPPKRQLSANDNKHLPRPSITSILSSLLQTQPMNNSKKNFVYSSSDSGSSSVEDECIPRIKGKEHDVNEEDASASTSCSRTVNGLDSNIICQNFYDHEKFSNIKDNEQRCATCYSRRSESKE